MNVAAARCLGILMLDTRFPRPPGDIGNVQTFARHGIPVRLTVVRGASPRRIVQEADAALLRPFIDAARQLVDDGAAMITTSCGFLASWQQALADALPAPVFTSSLLACARFEHPGIVTFDAASLSAQVLLGAGVPGQTPVQGVLPGCEFHARILNDDDHLDLVEARRNVVDAALRLVEAHPDVDDIVLECTNMPPYREAIEHATGRRVHDIETLLVAQWQARVDPSIGSLR
ncbi:MAG: hypothetical protein JWQ11_717 [Rhizobacter sp.]|nr:hypothetical protein [Rhizobacter sp.]